MAGVFLLSIYPGLLPCSKHARDGFCRGTTLLLMWIILLGTAYSPLKSIINTSFR